MLRTLALTLLLAISASAAPKPKYGPRAMPLSVSHEYFQTSSAPDYWALAPFYIPQVNEAACSLASITMLVNAARGSRGLGSEDELVTQTGLIERVKLKTWSDWVVSPTGVPTGKLVLEDLATYAQASLKSVGLQTVAAEVVHGANAKRVHELLATNEKSSADLILANFDQFSFIQDAHVGHVAPVGAYDAKRRRVLIMDPDRKWYEPYWVDEAVFMEGIKTIDSSSGKTRGIVWVRVR